MLSSLLLKYFKNLTKKDRRELSKFVRSPFHNQRDEVIRLFDYLHKHIDTPSVKTVKDNNKEYSLNNLKKANIYTAIYPDKKDFNDALIRATMSQLLELIKAYFIHSELKDNKKYAREQAFILRQSLLQKGYKEEYEQYLVQDYNNSTQEQRQGFYHHFVILNEKMSWQAKYNRSENLYLDEMSETLDAAYIVELLRIACRMKSHKAITIVDYRLELLETVLKLLETGWLNKHLYVQVFYNAYGTMQYKEENYQALDTLLRDDNTHHNFEMSDLHFLYEVALNYNIHLLNHKNLERSAEIWWYLKTGFERKILLQNNIISPHNVISIVSLGLSRYVNDVMWVDNFMDEYKKFMPPTHREDYILLVEGIYHFYRKNYKKSIFALKKVSFEDEYHQLRSRRMLAIMYFELSKLDILESHLESFKVYLYRLKTMAYQKEANLHFVRFFEKLLHINLSNRQDCLVLWSQIEQVSCVAMSEWFKEKLV